MMDILGVILVGVITGIITHDICVNNKSIFAKLIIWATMLAPKQKRERLGEEWHAHIDELRGFFPKLITICGFFLASCTIRCQEFSSESIASNRKSVPGRVYKKREVVAAEPVNPIFQKFIFKLGKFLGQVITKTLVKKVGEHKILEIPEKRVYLRDIATRVGVHPSTVARILNADKRALVSEQIVEQVIRQANDLGYAIPKNFKKKKER